MNTKITNLHEKNQIMYFTIENIPTCAINSIRRIITVEIPCFVFRTFPHNENKVEMLINTSRHNNEILKQRLGCIPIHIDDMEFPYEDHRIEVNKKNDGKSLMFLTTEDFKVYNIQTKKYLSDASTRKIFPSDPITGDYIILARLRAKLADNLDGEQIKFIAKIDISTAQHDGMYNVASTCSYGCTIDPIQVEGALIKYTKELSKKKITKDEIEFEIKNWRLLEAKRFIKPESFDFILETVGVFSNNYLMYEACNVMINKLLLFIDNIKSTEIKKNIRLEENMDTTTPNEYIMTVAHEDYTLGNVIVHYLYQKHFINDKDINFCGFNKPHPHINEGIFRIAFINKVSIETVSNYFIQAANKAIELFTNIGLNFENVNTE